MALDSSHIKAEMRYQARAPCTELLENVQALATLGLRRNQRRPWLTGMGCSSLMFAIFFTLVFTSRRDDELTGGKLVLVVILAIGGFVILFLRGTDQAFDLDARHPELILRVVRLLQNDIAPGEPVTLEFDLRPEHHDSKVLRTSTNARGWTVRHCLDPWLVLQGRLLDGNRFRLDLTERVKRYDRTKRSSSGRTKYKHKRKARALLRVRLELEPGRHPHLGRLKAAADRAVRLPEGTRLEALRVGANHLDMTVLMEQPWLANELRESTVYGPQVVGMCFLSLYQMLHLSRALETTATAER